MESPFELSTYGSLNLNTTTPTLSQMEEFCAEARRLGLSDNTKLHSTKQGMLGPVTGWHFEIPVEPKKTNT